MKAFLINPEAKSITEVEVPDRGDRLPTIYKHLHCDSFDVVCLTNNDAVYVDDEGLHKPLQHFFAIKGYPQPLAGRGLVLGADARGNTVEPAITLEQLVEATSFIELFTKKMVTVRPASKPTAARIMPLSTVLSTLEQEAEEA